MIDHGKEAVSDGDPGQGCSRHVAPLLQSAGSSVDGLAVGRSSGPWLADPVPARIALPLESASRPPAIVTFRAKEGDMSEPEGTDAAEFEIDAEELRRRSDQIVETIAKLANLEVDKREAQPGTAAFVDTARSVRKLAQTLLDLARDEQRLAERLQRLREDAGGAVPGRPIAQVPGVRPIAVVLAEWREAERRLTEAEAGSEAEQAAEADAARLREEYQRAAAGGGNRGV
jgi:hypothetical protein